MLMWHKSKILFQGLWLVHVEFILLFHALLEWSQPQSATAGNYQKPDSLLTLF